MRKPDPLLVVIIILSLVLGVAVLDRGHDWGDDFASYIMQAKSIYNATMPEFLEHNRFTINQSSIVIGPVAYPWGYPLLLVPAYALKGINALALKLPGLLLFQGFLLCLYWLTKNRLTRTESLLLVSLFAFNPLLVSFHNQIISDIPFLAFSTCALWLMVRDDRRGTCSSLILGAVIACAFFVRTQGILLLAGYGLVEFVYLLKNGASTGMGKKIIWSLFLVCAGFGFLWLLYALIFPGGGESYFAQFKDFQIEKVYGSFSGYFQVFSLFFGEGNIWESFYRILVVFALIGLWVRRKNEAVLFVFYIIWMVLLAVWPAWQGPRFIFPLLPVFMYFVFQGMKGVLQAMPESRRAWGQQGFVLLWLVILGMFIYQSGSDAYKNLSRDRKANDAFASFSMDMFEFVRENTPRDSVIVFFKPRAMRLFTDRDSYMALTCPELTRGDYIVINKKAENSQVPEDAVDECGIPIRGVYENKWFSAYEIKK